MARSTASEPIENRSAAMLDGLGVINVPKSCDVLAERLQQEILSGVYAHGSALPTERDLVSVRAVGKAFDL